MFARQLHNDNAIYDFSDGKHRIDFAARYSHNIGEWEFGLSFFNGTGREPTDYQPVALSANGEKSGIHSFKTVGGFEHTWVGMFDSDMDLGFVVEYHYSDQRISETIFDNNLATSLRFVFNDAQSSEILAGVFTDADIQTLAGFIEASRRLGDSWTMEFQLRTFNAAKQGQPLYSFRFDDFAQLDLSYHF